ncbi:MAG: SpoIID/LytB domain-containing protein [Actinomycetota bacterium]
MIRRLAASVVATLAVASLCVSVVVLSPPGAEAQQAGELLITGRGWGHGRGMGQYGAYGYARDHGWSSAQILDHYYGGTRAGPAPANAAVDPDQVRVELRFMRGRPTTVGLEDGAIHVLGANGAPAVSVTGAVRLTWVGSGYVIESASSCDGPWTGVATIAAGTVTIRRHTTATGRSGLLSACGLTYSAWYDGDIQAVVDDGAPRTVNVVSIEEYIRGVVPNEMPASWPAAALEAQAVAARSYALAGDTRQQPYADTCDTIRCQVYDGRFTERGGSLRSATHARTDAAIAATAGLVRLDSAGRVARTEFSSSTGGHTVGGSFTAVPDAGDAIDANPNHTWQVTVDASRLENRYRLGELRDASVVERNGHGADGGRAVEVELVFAAGTIRVDANVIRSLLGLKSDWFTIASPRRSTAAGSFIDQSFELLAGRPASDAELDTWFADVDRGDRRAMVDRLVRDEPFAGQLLDGVYQRALGRGADGAGRAYWLDAMENGLGLTTVGVLFFSSPEYYAAAGGTTDGYVNALYRDLLGRSPDGDGLRYWRNLLDSGRARRTDVAAGFQQSEESRRDRAVDLHVMVYGSAPTDALATRLADHLRSYDDLDATAALVAGELG